MDIQKEKDAYLGELLERDAITQDEYNDIIFRPSVNAFDSNYLSARFIDNINWGWNSWQAAKAQTVPNQLDINSILHDIDCYFDNGLSNTERTANNLIQSIYEKLSGEIKAQEQSHE